MKLIIGLSIIFSIFSVNTYAPYGTHHIRETLANIKKSEENQHQRRI